MSHSDKSPLKPVTGLIVAAVMLLLAVAVLVLAYGFEGGSGLFPRFIGWIFVVLAGSEVLLNLQRMLAAKQKPQIDNIEEPQGARAVLVKEIKGILWVGVLLVGIYLAGILITLPVYLFSFIRFSGKRTIQQSAIIAVCSTAFVYLLFVVLLDYKLYPGILFGA
jgi:hypothetical protein